MKQLLLMLFVVGFGIVGEVSAQSVLQVQREVLTRSFRLPTTMSVEKDAFKEIAEKQLCDRYYLYSKEGKWSLVEIKRWEEGLFGLINCKPTGVVVPTEVTLEMVAKVDEGMYTATQLEPKTKWRRLPLVYVEVLSGMTYTPGEIVTCGVVPRKRSMLKDKVPMGAKGYQMLPEATCAAWRKPTAEDLYRAYQAGYPFLVKTETRRMVCPVCEGGGIDEKRYEKIVASIKQREQRKKTSSSSMDEKLQKAQKNKPLCKTCKGKKHLLLDEFRLLSIEGE
ncbi:MAG: hypothetical protein Q4F99_05865 [bacterium]|nr:hypothetical protein [bacterium]